MKTTQPPGCQGIPDIVVDKRVLVRYRDMTGVEFVIFGTPAMAIDDLRARPEQPGNNRFMNHQNMILSQAEEITAGTPLRVAVLGASSNAERYSHMAVVLLKEMGFDVILIHPTLEQIEGLAVVKLLEEISEEVDTLTLYVGPKRVIPLLEAIVQLAPRRVIFNPGTESVEAIEALRRSGIDCIEACTLVMLKTGQF